jgi:ABC-2 type transport system permease protein
MCLFLGWAVHNDIAYDSTAFWTHVSANTSGVDDRWGRLVPALFVGIPLVLLGSLITVLITGGWNTLPALVGLSACVLLVALGISSVMSAGFPYPAVHPGDSPFAQPQAAGTAGSVVQSLSFFATILLAAPVVGLVVLGMLFDPVWYWAALGGGLFIGTVALYVGVHWGGRIVRRRAPELLAFTLQN